MNPITKEETRKVGITFYCLEKWLNKCIIWHMPKNERSPVIVVVGHIDHGKSKLLDYIRKSNVVEKEAGGITQHISAYEVEVPLSDGRKKQITFLDTPGHAAFSKMRSRSCNIADIAILIVSAEEGVKAQTLEALKSIKGCNIPFVVAINKIDKPEANVEKTKNSLLKNEVYLEGLGGDIPYVPVSAETGKGIPDLLETIVLLAEVEELKGNPEVLGTGFVIETNMDSKRGISASLIIKDGHIKSGMYIVSGESSTPVRIMENFLGKAVKKMGPSDPVNITGWNKLPKVGNQFKAYKNKKEAWMEVEKTVKKETTAVRVAGDAEEGRIVIPVIIKGDTQGSVEAIVGEIEKIETEGVIIKITEAKTGNITENDVKIAGGNQNSIILGFNVKEDRGINTLAERLGVEIQLFDIIYRLTEWLEKKAVERKPRIKVEETSGKARILKIFSKSKEKQVVGGEVFEGKINKGDKIKITRRGEEIGNGNILELQITKTVVESVNEGNQFGAKISSGVEIAEKDNIESFSLVEK
jgi:translation initiation factor IF-2